MAWVRAVCGCELEIEMGWDYGCAGDCCGGSEVPEGATFISTCDLHTPLDSNTK